MVKSVWGKPSTGQQASLDGTFVGVSSLTTDRLGPWVDYWSLVEFLDTLHFIGYNYVNVFR